MVGVPVGELRLQDVFMTQGTLRSLVHQASDLTCHRCPLGDGIYRLTWLLSVSYNVNLGNLASKLLC